MNKVYALTILYLGKEIEPDVANAIAEVMMRFGTVISKDNITVIYKDSESIANAILAKESEFVELKKNNARAAENEKIVAAISYVGKMFREDLEIAKSSKNYAPFIVHVIQCAVDDFTLQKSIDIIVDSKISSALLKQYGLTDNAVLAIKSIKANNYARRT